MFTPEEQEYIERFGSILKGRRCQLKKFPCDDKTYGIYEKPFWYLGELHNGLYTSGSKEYCLEVLKVAGADWEEV